MSGLAPVAGTTPYPWPYDGATPGACLALVVAGWDDGWRTRATDPATAERAVAELARAVVAAGGSTWAAAHAGAAPAPLDDAEPVAAVGIDAFYATPLDHRLRAAGATHLLLAGHGLEGPVHSTLRAANDRGYECLLVADATSALVPALAGPARSMVELSGGIFGAVGATAEVLRALAPIPVGRTTP